MISKQDYALELIKVEVWLKAAQQQLSEYKEPHEREPGEIKRFEYYLQAAASEASFALEHLVRAVHFYCEKHPEPSFQMTEALLEDANTFLAEIGLAPLGIDVLDVLRAAIAIDEDVSAKVNVDKVDLVRYINSIREAYARVASLV